MNKNGFTLIELVIALAVSVIMFGMVTVSFVSVEKQKLFQSANILRTNLRYCQKNAMDEKRKYELTFNTVENLYYIKRADDTGFLKKISQINLPSGINISSNAKNNSIAYTSSGTSGSACTINLRGKNFFIEMTVNVGCGRVKINPIQKFFS